MGACLFVLGVKIEERREEGLEEDSCVDDCVIQAAGKQGTDQVPFSIPHMVHPRPAAPYSVIIVLLISSLQESIQWLLKCLCLVRIKLVLL